MLVLWQDGLHQRPLRVTLLSEDFMAGFIVEMYITYESQWSQYLYGTGLKEDTLQVLLKPTEAKYTVTLQNPKTQALTMVYCPNLDFLRGVYTFCQLTGGFSERETQLILSHQNQHEVEIVDKVWHRFSTVILNISGMTVAEAYTEIQK